MTLAARVPADKAGTPMGHLRHLLTGMPGPAVEAMTIAARAVWDADLDGALDVADYLDAIAEAVTNPPG